MSRCEFHEIALSALLDGALDRAETLPTVDHLLACPSCQEFYRDARALAALVGRTGGAGTGERALPGPPEAVWRRIEADSSRRRLPAWVGRAAAVLLLAGGGWWAASRVDSLPGVAGPPASREVVLGGESGRMTDGRFVELATEVLEADPRYRREMLRVMREADEQGGRPEAPVEDGVRTEEDRRSGEEGPGGPA